MKFVMVILCLVGAAIAIIGGIMALDQHRQVTTFVPVSARVLNSYVAEHKGSKGSRSYTPEITYQYEVGGAVYTSNRVLPLRGSGSRSWAGGVVAAYPTGAEAQAYYNPASPGRSILVRRHGVEPHVLVMVGLMMLSAGLLIPTWRGAAPGEPEPAGRGWFALPIVRTVRSRARGWLLSGMAWEGAVAAALVPYYAVAERPIDTGDTVLGWVMGGLGTIPFMAAAYYTMMGSVLGEAVVRVDRPALAVGSDVKLRVEQTAYRAARIDELAVGLVCRKTAVTHSGGKARSVTTTAHEEWRPLVENRDAMNGEELGGTVTIDVPVTSSPTTVDEAGQKKSFPRYQWHVAVRTRVGGRPDYRARFAVVVVGGGRRG